MENGRIALSYKNALLAFRFIGFLLLLFLLVYKPEGDAALLDSSILPLVIYLASNAFLFFLTESQIAKSSIQFTLFLADILIISWTIYLAQGWSSDMYLIYFLVIFMSGIQMRVWQSFLVGTLACIVYGFFASRGEWDSPYTAHVLLRFPFFYLISFYTAFMAHYSREINKLSEQVWQERVGKAEQRARFGRLAGRTASEMSTPLSVISGFAQGLRTRVDESHEFYLPVSSIMRESKRSVQLLENLFLLSDEVDSNMEAVDINALVQNVVSESGGSGVSLEFTPGTLLPMVRGDRKQLFHAIKNIVDNAVEAMPNGGKIVISSRAARDKVEVTILDTGRGIPDELKEHVFEPFITSGGDHKSGLGLSIASAILERHGGAISFESRPGRGTTFKLSLAVS